MFEARRIGQSSDGYELFEFWEDRTEIGGHKQSIGSLVLYDKEAAEAVVDALNVHYKRVPLEEPKGELGED